MKNWDESTFAQILTPSDVKISPDGSIIAYTLNRADLKGDKYETSLIVRKTDSKEEIKIPNASISRFAPNGKMLAYSLSTPDNEDWSEVWLLDIGSSEKRKIFEDGKVSEIDWSPDGSKLCIVMNRRRTDSYLHYDDNYPIWFNDRGFLDRESSIITICDAATGSKVDEIEEKVFLMPKSPYLPYFRVALWHGNSSLLLNEFRRENPFESNDIFLYQNGNKKKLFEKASLRAISSNGNDVVMIGKPEKRSGYMEHNFLFIWNGSKIEPLTPRYTYEDSSIPGAEPKSDSNGRLYYVSLRRGRTSLHSIKTGEEERAEVDEDSSVTSFDVARDGAVALIKESPSHMPEVYLLQGKNLSQLTNHNESMFNDLSPKPLYKINFTGVAGLKIDAWYLKPDINSGERAPVVLFIHGGPKGMYGYSFDFLGQLFANRGYYVLYANPRGSAGYDEDFATVIIHKYGDDDFKDIMQAVDELLSLEKSADKDKLGVTGISGGGFLTNWTITHSSNFKAAISENGICNWFSHYAGSDIGYWFCTELLGEDPLKDDSNFKFRSPIYYSRSVSTPVLFIHSMADYRCPPDQGIMFHQVLRSLGKESYIAMFKKGEHGHSRTGSPVHRSKRHKLMVDFFETKLVKNQKEFDPEFF